MIIHQIFLKVSDKTLEDYPIYIEGIKIWKELCKKHNWEYKLWTEIPQDILDEDDKFILDDSKNKEPFIKVDYLRYIILEKYGGMYVDLDITPNDKFTEIMNDDIIIGVWKSRNIKDDFKILVNNSVIKLSKEYASLLRKYCIDEYKNKLNIEIYNTWKKRFLLQSVGSAMFRRFCKKQNICNTFNNDDFEIYFIDKQTTAWLD
tara:strand:- start:2988 stop:3599 length:612 start_codon:yes stop_codon:yes gene_type:complete